MEISHLKCLSALNCHTRFSTHIAGSYLKGSMNEVAKSPTKGSTSAMVFMTPPRKPKHKSLMFSISPKNCCTSTESPQRRSCQKRKSPASSTPTDASSSLTWSKHPLLLDVKTAGVLQVGSAQSGETKRGRRRLALPPLPDHNHTFRPVSENEQLPLLPGVESILVTPLPQVNRSPYLPSIGKESIHEARPISLKRLYSQRRPSFLFGD
jgi:hypothetical protein